MSGIAPLPTLRRVLARMHLRVTLFAVGLTGLTVLLAGFAAIGAYAGQNLHLIGRSAGYSAAPSIVFDDPVSAQQAIAPLLEPGVAGIALIKPDGTVLATVEREGQDDSLARWIADRLFFASPVDEPVIHLGSRIGTVRVRGEGSGVAAYIRDGVLGTLVCLVLTGLAAWLLSRRLRADIVEPLNAIVDAAHGFRREETLDPKVPPASIREVEALRIDFNALIAELGDWRQHMRRENETLSYKASHDALTGLPNRALFERRVGEMLAEARAGEASFVLLYADADSFKPINDRHGHAAGDAVLIEVAARIRNCLRARDVAARLGGDEFAILLAAPSGADAAERVAGEIAARMAEPFRLPSGETVAMTLSLGAAIYPGDGQDLTTLINRADAAMYVAKGDLRARQQGV
ncbi:diguanylate cyclase [Sphingomonas koreensis]|uniref:diguanylate cyclase domain-containing protein n=1 Tax=Sphingomonas koreensis TaxID=93064 RepID=UPI0008369AEF|nr:diguanylate cyclase [Sphingomonas koreensis]PJI90078.1 diguanylate cyclase (GGDEF)-like protein [Sphingomonas koreensis]RSU62478.1 diguanylate cyclase [Sphingomonas koreensis]RSU70189.1 diguanylate cyclase [Sphingomonas koreensis]